MVLQKNGLITKKDKANFKIYYVTTSLTNIAIHMFPNISRNKGNQKMIGQLIKWHETYFLEKLYPKCSGETILRPISKTLKLNVSLDQPVKSFIQFVSITYQADDCRNILKLGCKPPAFTSYMAFLKTKRGLELVFLLHFLHGFWRKLFLLLYSINWPNCIAWLSLLRETLGNMYIVIVC